jgi:protein-disulfide isomerase
MSRIILIVGLVTLTVPLKTANSRQLLAANECAAISSATAHRLAKYVQDKFGFAAETVLELASSDIVDGSCYRKIRFRRQGSDELVSLVLFLSPEQRFVTRELLDSSIDVVEERRAEEQQLLAELTNGQFPTKGFGEAPIVVTLFSDFQCPYCKQAAEVFNKGFGHSELRIVFRNLPLPFHGWARAAAEMCACVFQQSNDAFWAVHDVLFEQQEKLTNENLANVVKTFLIKRRDVDVGLYEKCVLTRQTAQRIDQDLAFAMKYNIHATPTMFINGIRMDGVAYAETIRALARLASSKSPSGNR